MKANRKAVSWVLIIALDHGLAAPVVAAQPTTLQRLAQQYSQSNLPTGGLVVYGTGSVPLDPTGNVLIVTQTSGKAIYTWSSFDIGNGYKVVFQQPTGGVALNRISDSGNPSQIQGALQANGTIYLINPSGIIFSSTAQVNVGSLVASTLDVSDNIFKNNSIVTAIQNQLPAFDCTTNSSCHANVAITLEKGATITASDGGSVMIFAPQVTNNGSISTPDGQTILAASADQVYLTPSTASGLRGLFVEVNTGGNVTNVGNIIAARGNITLLGAAVNQDGRLTATTSVDANGSIRLLARDNVAAFTTTSYYAKNPLEEPQNSAPTTNTGSVTIGPGSVTEILPDTQLDAKGSVKQAPDALVQLPSVVEVVGKTVQLQNNATIHAPGGTVDISALDNLSNPNSNLPPTTTAGVTLGSGTVIDVSGTTGTVHAAGDAVLAVGLFGIELADAPLQRNGVLSRQTVYVNAQKGTPIADISQAQAGIERSIDERLSTGGSVNLTSSGKVSLDSNSLIDIAGGKVHYDAGKITLTYVRDAAGNWVNLSSADPNTFYAAIRNYQFNAPAYDVGANAGNLDIVTPYAPTLAAGVIQGGVTMGMNQRALANQPHAGTLTIDLNQFQGRADDTGLDIVGTGAFTGAAGQIDASLFQRSGLGSVDLQSGSVRIEQGANIGLQAGGSFSITAKSLAGEAVSLQDDGIINISSGSVNLNVTQADQVNATAGGLNALSLTLGPDAQIITRGMWINDYLAPSSDTTVLAYNGGAITLASAGLLTTISGSLLDASGGAYFNRSRALHAGTGGNISISASNPNSLEESPPSVAQLQLNGTLRSFSLSKGGELALTDAGFVLGGSANTAGALSLGNDFFTENGFSAYTLTSTAAGIVVASGAAINPTTLNWSYAPQLLKQKTGSDFLGYMSPIALPEDQRSAVNLTLSSQTAITAANTLAALTVQKGASITLEPGANLTLNAQTQMLIDGTLTAPGGNVRLTLNSGNSGYPQYDQAIVLGANSRISTAGTFVRQTNITHPNLLYFNTFDAGTINITADNGYVFGESGALLDASGATQRANINVRNQNGQVALQTTDQVAAAGTIHLQAAEGIVFDGSYRAQAAPVAGAAGGRLEIVLDTNSAGPTRLADTVDPLSPSVIDVSQAATAAVPAAIFQRDGNGQLLAVNGFADILQAAGIANNSTSVSSAKIAAGGFGQLLLEATSTKSTQPQTGYIQFYGNVDLGLSQSIELASNSLVTDGGNVNVHAPYVAWGFDWSSAPYSPPSQSLAPTHGTGQLTLAGSFVDLIGNLSVAGADTVNIASATDLRVRGSSAQPYIGALSVDGNLNLTAQQLYPATLQQFSFNVSGDPLATPATGTLSVLGVDGTPATVLSAGGTLNFNAPVIVQAGTVKAPDGSLNFNATQSLKLAPGSLTSVALDTALVPFGTIVQSTTWQYGTQTVSLMPGAGGLLLPQKSISLSAPSQTLAGGATINASGGGDLYAYEFIPGTGGSQDVLAPTNAGNSFAIVPSLALAYAPYDVSYATEAGATAIKPGTTITLVLDGVQQSYAVLPARYAMLPGAELVTPVSSLGNFAPGSTLALQDGSTVVAGRFSVANTGIVGNSWSAFDIESQAQVFNRSQYDIETGNKFFSGQFAGSGQLSSADAGLIQILAGADLSFAATLRAAGADGGRGGELDIQAHDIAVVNAQHQTGTGIKLLDTQLNGMTLGTLLLGGVSEHNGATTQINVAANTVSIGDGVILSLPELILAANQSIEIGANAHITATGGTASSTTTTIDVTNGADNQGALLRLSSTNQADIVRNVAAGGTQGQLNVASSAVLAADSAIAVDVSDSANLAGTFKLNSAGSFAISAPQISVGDNQQGSGLVVSAAQLNGTGAGDVAIKTSGNLDFNSVTTLQANTLEISAAHIVNDSVGGNVNFNAGQQLTLTGVGSDNAAAIAGTGMLALQAPTIALAGKQSTSSSDAASLALDGFSAVNLTATSAVTARNNLKLSSAADVAVATPLLTSASGANLVVNATGAFNVNGGTGNLGAAAGNSGAVTINANSISIDTAAVLPGGSFTANATQDLSFGSNGRIDVAGFVLSLGDETVAIDGGNVTLSSATGNINIAQVLQSGNVVSSIDVSGSSNPLNGSNAGSITLANPQGQLTLNGQLVGLAASPAYTGGSLSVDTSTLNTGASSLLGAAQTGGFTGAFSLRQRTGDLTINGNVTAANINFAVDNGSLEVASTLDADGVTAGSISLAAGNSLTLDSTAQLFARALPTSQIASAVPASTINADQRGGSVLLSARDGTINLQNGSGIDVSARGNGAGGTVTLRAQRTQAGVAITQWGAAVTGANSIDIDAVQSYVSDTVSGVLSQAQTDAQNFISAVGGAAAWLQGLGASANVQQIAQLRPEVEIDSNPNSDLTVDTPVDLSSWRFVDPSNNNTVPVVLTLRAANNLNVNNTISDGFSSAASTATLNAASAGQSADLHLVAGADLGAASVDAVIAGRGNIALAPDVLVRTGTGNIDVTAGGSLTFGNSSAAIYTAGQATLLQPNGANSGYSSAVLAKLMGVAPSYPVDGGAVNINVGGDISVASVVPGVPMDWLYRAGNASIPATWGIAFNRFGGIGTLGGGNINVNAGGSIAQVQIAAPTTGKQVGQFTATSSRTGVTLTNFPGSSPVGIVDVEGGGDVNVRAGGDIASSSIYVADGRGTIMAGGGLIASGPVSNLLGIGDAQVSINARDRIDIDAVYNPTVALQSGNQAAAGLPFASYFFTYSASSAVTLRSATGDVDLRSQLLDDLVSNSNYATYNYYNNSTNQGTLNQGSVGQAKPFVTVLPAVVSIVAANGSIVMDDRLTLFPTPSGNLQLLAADNIHLANGLAMSDAAQSSLAGLQNPVPGATSLFNITAAGGSTPDTNMAATSLALFGSGSATPGIAPSAPPLHGDDSQPIEIVAATGDIYNNGILFLTKQAHIYAGGDIAGGSANQIRLQNINPGDVSSVYAAGDISFQNIVRNITNGVSSATDGIIIGGPGQLDVLAGGNISLGTSQGIQSEGNLLNSNLTAQGATVNVLAGIGVGANGPAYQAFANQYLSTNQLVTYIESSPFEGATHFADRFISDIEAATGISFDVANAVATLNSLTSAQRQSLMSDRALILDAFFYELRAGGVAATLNNGQEGYTRSYRAIDTLFPNAAKNSGDIGLVSSLVQSNAGGTVNVLAPSGKIDVGLPVPSSNGAAQGIVVSEVGDINTYSLGDVNVNQSKVIAQNGGYITMFSRIGSIDAGRGSRSALVLPPPVVSYDQYGNLHVTPSPAVTGSGIQAGCSSNDCTLGTVYLSAPNGFIDAGDAGIQAGNLFLAAQQVLHTDAISVSGSAYGVPQAPVLSIGLGANDAAASAMQSAQNTAANAGDKDKGALGERGLALLTIDILGYGSSQEDDDKHERR